MSLAPESAPPSPGPPAPPQEREALEADWERVASLIADGEVDHITAHLGDVMQVRPKAANSKVRRRAPSEDGAIGWSLPCGLYLRTSFTHAILQAAMAWRVI